MDAGAAIGALECDGKTPYQRGEHGYDDGLAKVQESAEAALDDYMSESGPIFSTPPDGYVAADDVRDWNDDAGWGIRAWAQCEPSELPPEVTDELNIGVWEDDSGQRVPVTRIQSFQGAEHCDWTDITFLLVGPERKADWYVRDTDGGDLTELLHTTFTNDAALADGATDAGLRRDGRRLWIGPDEKAAYLVRLDDPEDVERWPAAKQPIQCA